MADDEIQLVEVTVRTGSPKRKRKRKESPVQPEATDTPSNGDIVYKAAQLKRRLAFCEKEQKELTKRFKAIKEQLTEAQSCELEVKLENSDKHVPLICIGDSSDGDDDVMFILPEDYSPLKRRKIEDAKKAETSNSADQPKKDVAITYYKPATNLPHAREHCTVNKFVQSNVTTATVSCNESCCEQCYCYVCDAPVKECDSWKTGTNPHCNAYAKNTFWEKLRKMVKRKTSAVQDSLLKCLAADEQTETMKAAAAKVIELLETLKDELNDSSSSFNSRLSSPACDCECHYQSDDSYNEYSGEGCDMCCEEHFEYNSCAYDWPFNGRFGRFTFSLSDSVSTTVSKATDYLKNDEPGPAALVLDALTVLLLPSDNERNRWPYHQVTGALKSLRKAWIEVLMHADLPKNVEEKVRERLKNAVDGALICSPESTGLKSVLEMKKWSDESLVKCFAGKLGGVFIKEDEEVAEARVSFLEKKKRFSDALLYMLGCKVTPRTRAYSGYYGSSLYASTEKQLVNTVDYRNKFILLLAKTGKIDQALNVITMPYTVELDKDVLTNNTPKAVGSNVNYSQSALGSMSYSNMKEFLSAFISDDSSAEEGKLPSPQIIPEAKLRTVLALVLTGAQVNSLLRTETAMEWYINTFCESSFFNILAKDVRQKFLKEAGEVVVKAKNKLLTPSEIKPPFKGPFNVFVVELFAALTVSVFVNTNLYRSYSITSTMEVFKKKSLQWACISMVLSSTITSKITPQIVGFVLDNVLKVSKDYRSIPFEVYESWIKKLSDVNGIEKNCEIALCMLNEGKTRPEGSSMQTEAVQLVRKIIEAIEAMLNKSSHWDKDKLFAVIRKIKFEFGFGPDDMEFWQTSVLFFKNNPSHSMMFVVKESCSPEMWPKFESSMMNFLKKHRTSHTEACIDIFAQCDKYSEVKLTLAAKAYSSSDVGILDQIKRTLSSLEHRRKVRLERECQDDDGSYKFADACVDWLGKTMCDAAFQNWRHNYMHTSIPEPVLNCLKNIAKLKIETFNDILSAAMRDAACVFCNNTVSYRHRTELERWLKEIKALYCKKKQQTAWSWAFHELTTGRLKRKPAVIKQLKNSTSLLSGTIPYHQLLKMQAAEKAASTAATNAPTSKPASTSSHNNNTAKSTQGNAAPKQGANMAASTPSNSSTTKPAISSTTKTSASACGTKMVNMATSTPNIPNVKPAQGTPATSQPTRVVAASTPSTTPSSKPAQGTAAPKQPVNMAASTPKSTSNAKPSQGTPATQPTRVVLGPKQPVNTAASTATKTPKAKPSQGFSTAVNTSENRIQSLQMPRVTVQLANVNTGVSSPAMTTQQMLNNLIANTAAYSNKTFNVAIRVPPNTTKAPTTTPRAGTFVSIAPNTTTAAMMSRTTSTAKTTSATVSVSGSSTVTSSTSSSGSRV